jgi:hypothetical protein
MELSMSIDFDQVDEIHQLPHFAACSHHPNAEQLGDFLIGVSNDSPMPRGWAL